MRSVIESTTWQYNHFEDVDEKIKSSEDYKEECDPNQEVPMENNNACEGIRSAIVIVTFFFIKLEWLDDVSSNLKGLSQ
jgi:hypothetical protein